MGTRRDPAGIGRLPIVRRAAAAARSVHLPRAATARIIIATTARRVANAAMRVRPRAFPTRSLAKSDRTPRAAKALTENLAETRNFRVEPAGTAPRGIATATGGTAVRARILAAAP